MYDGSDIYTSDLVCSSIKIGHADDSSIGPLFYLYNTKTIEL